MLTLVLGGARSGKSRWGENLVASYNKPKLYIATAQAFDAEMAERIAQHKQQRHNAAWHTAEEPLNLHAVLGNDAYKNHAILVDCLTLWLSNLMHHNYNVGASISLLQQALATRQAPTVLISNEVSMGLVANTPLGRAFVDAAGRLHQTLAIQAQRVVLVVAGIAMPIKTP